jgi:2'-5' RNA ligase
LERASVTAPARYAVYLAPPPTSALWRFGCDVLGRDAAAGERRSGFAIDGIDADAWRELTAEPRRYGFHATLKAPFRLNAGLSLDELFQAIAALAGALTPFDAGPLGVSTIAAGPNRAFVALTPIAPSGELARLENAVVRSLDRFRAPLTDSERLRRDPARLSPRQRDTFETWGYPYALDEFRPHFTLSNAVADAEAIAAALAQEFERRVGRPFLTVDALVLFAQNGADGDFAILRRFPLGASEAA